jgi:hypothetical protein
MCFLILTAAAGAQTRRDHLTDMEADVVRDTQEVDKRMGVFLKAIDRRLAVLAGSTVDPAKQGKIPKDAPDWGPLPEGTTAQLYQDIERILDEAINGIDDIATREPDSKLMHKAVRILGEGCKKLIPQLKAFNDKSTEPKEKESLANAMEYAQSVIDSLNKVPTEEEEKKDKKKSKN